MTSDENEEPVGDPGSEPQDPGATAPITLPAAAAPGRRLNNFRNGLTSRAAGWVVAAVLAGAVIALSVTGTWAASPVGVRIAAAGPIQFAPVAGVGLPDVVLPGVVLPGVGPPGPLGTRLCAPIVINRTGPAGPQVIRVFRRARATRIRACVLRPRAVRKIPGSQVVRVVGPGCGC